ncbi:hypothetical protein P4B35_15750 [Pontiellaceae bacterium B12227]|nr:hypothetical protein [Pontiellaceae bacterium B12227]
MSGKKRFFASHAKSSAALVSLGIHAVLIVIALSFVAVTVIQKEDQNFEAKPVNRPKMQLKKLQVPVNIKRKKTQKPKLRKRIVVQPKLNQNVPDIKMPEITGVKGGLGNAAGAGLGGGGGLGFSMPEIEIFGIKGKGEKVFLILDTSNSMLVDEMGGIPAYTIIKEELLRIVDSLPSTALINVAVFRGNDVQTAFPQMAPASKPNADKVRAWLEPLNSSANAAKSGRYGTGTLGPGGTRIREDLRTGNFAKPVKKGGSIYGGKSGGHEWFNAVMLAHKQQADTIFLLTDRWGHQAVAVNTAMTTEEWIETTSAGKKWAEKVEEGKKLLAEENKKRKEKGEPPKVIEGGRWGLIREYFPGVQQPPRPQYYQFVPKEFAEAFMMVRDKYNNQAVPTSSGLGKRKSSKKDFSFNVVHFVEKDATLDSRTADNFNKLTRLCSGDYQTVAGLEEIQSYVSGSEE